MSRFAYCPHSFLVKYVCVCVCVSFFCNFIFSMLFGVWVYMLTINFILRQKDSFQISHREFIKTLTRVMDSHSFTYSHSLEGHTDEITAISCPLTTDSDVKLISSSRDRTLIAWNGSTSSGDPLERRLEGQSDIVSDVVISHCGGYAISASLSNSLRIWRLADGETVADLEGHSEEVNSVTCSADTRVIVSGCRDGTMKVWNVKGICHYTMVGHTDSVNSVRFCLSDTKKIPAGIIVSGSSDGTVKVWEEFTCVHTLKGHQGAVKAIAISFDGSLCASGGDDSTVIIWDLHEGSFFREFECHAPVRHVCFSPSRHWVCVAAGSKAKVFDLGSNSFIAELTATDKAGEPRCTCAAWSADGSVLYVGFSDSTIRVWMVQSGQC